MAAGERATDLLVILLAVLLLLQTGRGLGADICTMNQTQIDVIIMESGSMRQWICENCTRNDTAGPAEPTYANYSNVMHTCKDSCSRCQATKETKSLRAAVVVLVLLQVAVIAGWACTCWKMQRKTTRIRSTQFFNREETHIYTTIVDEPSVKYVRYGPSYENLPEKCQETEEQEGIYEVLKGEETCFIADGGVASTEDDIYDKLDFSRM